MKSNESIGSHETPTRTNSNSLTSRRNENRKIVNMNHKQHKGRRIFCSLASTILVIVIISSEIISCSRWEAVAATASSSHHAIDSLRPAHKIATTTEKSLQSEPAVDSNGNVKSNVITKRQTVETSAAANEEDDDGDQSGHSGNLNGHQSIESARPAEADDETFAQSQGLRAIKPDPLVPSATTRTQHGSNADDDELLSTRSITTAIGHRPEPKLKIVRLFAPEAVQNATQNVTIDCMFKFDRKLDQRLTIKWFFNDELEPIYQWIPDLNKRVYSDKFEQFLDKTYQVTDDVDFMLDAYKSQLAQQFNDNQLEPLDDHPADSPSGHHHHHRQTNQLSGGPADEAGDETAAKSLLANRKLLANRLNRLAKLGSEHSKQLIQSLRKSLLMEQLELSRFRALRLIRPTTQLNGRFTCSISSLDNDDLQSIRLVVYEPAKSFIFNVSRANQGQQAYNLTCQAGPMFPRPNLALFRYRAAQVESPPAGAAADGQQREGRAHAHSRPKLAATSLRQELISGTQTRLTISARSQPSGGSNSSSSSSGRSLAINREPRELSIDHLELAADEQPAFIENYSRSSPSVVVSAADDDEVGENERLVPMQQVSGAGSYEIVAWALVDESSLSGNLVSQFECVLTIDGANYEQRQSLSLQKGWHIHSAALSTRSTLVGLFSALASLLCLIVALVSSLLIFKLLRRHANQRKIHQAKTRAQLNFNPAARRGSSGGSKSSAHNANNKTQSPTSDSPATTATTNSAQSGEHHDDEENVDRDEIRSHDFPPMAQSRNRSSINHTTNFRGQNNNNNNGESEIVLAGPTISRGEEFALSRAEADNQQSNLNNNKFTGHYNIPTTTHIAGQQVITHHNSPQLQHQMNGFHQSPSDGIYRIPENSTFGTRFVIGPTATQLANSSNHRQWQQYYASQASRAQPYADPTPTDHLSQHPPRHQMIQATGEAGLTRHRQADNNEQVTAANVYQSNQYPVGSKNDHINGRPLYC